MLNDRKMLNSLETLLFIITSPKIIKSHISSIIWGPLREVLSVENFEDIVLFKCL